MEKADPNWWKTLFDEIYLITDARSVCDQALTRQEVDFLEQILKLEKSWPILDLCGGQGRHSLELSRRGFQDVTVVDYSAVLIDLGRQLAAQEGLKTLFLRKDARHTGLPAQRFRAIIIMASSFGYFLDEGENERILDEAFRLLSRDGLLLLDLPNRDYVLKNFLPLSWHEANHEIVVCRQRRRDENVLHCRELVISKTEGMIRDARYCTRLYSPEKITEMLASAGFAGVTVRTNFVSHRIDGDYGIMMNRMIVTARKD
ncbi:MAG: methyltransferase domain-containing protein [Proteobacteria bacterium]|nr:methyltransferase domain-containing protein [Pseudomonadota bacterium]NIS71717.1 methyltransferase domain-containing protein [Pseudomonadota bacterium]